MESQQWLSMASSTIYYALYPGYYLVLIILRFLLILATPIIYIAWTAKEISIIPLRFLSHFEALWYFLAAAVFVGAFFGLALHFTMRGFTFILKLDRNPEPKNIPARGHDAQSYRAARQEKKQRELEQQQKLATQARLRTAGPVMQDSARKPRGLLYVPQPASSASNPLSPGTQRPALLRETILEHTDEEDEDSAF